MAPAIGMNGCVRVWVRSLGCKVNLADAAEALGALGPDRINLVEAPGLADVAVLNTCTVTHKAERDARKILGSLRLNHPTLPVIVTGCAAASSNLFLSRFPNVRAVIPPGDQTAVTRAVCEVGESVAGMDDPNVFRRMGRQRAMVKIQDGCNAACAYCVVPRVRGRERSLPLQQVLARVDGLVRNGYREVVLVGIHLGRYGAGQGTSLAELIQRIDAQSKERSGPARIRLSSIEPMEWDESLFDALACSTVVCPHFHVPLQSGDDRVLERMRRPYRSGRFVEVISELQIRFPGAALGTDVLTGFPGETDREAQNTLELVQRLPLSYLHVFTFSDRPGTPAAEMPNHVDPRRVRERSAALLAEGRRHWSDFTKLGLGRLHQVLVEKNVDGEVEGRSEAYRRVLAAPSQVQPGDLVGVLARQLAKDCLLGVPVGS